MTTDRQAMPEPPPGGYRTYPTDYFPGDDESVTESAASVAAAASAAASAAGTARFTARLTARAVIVLTVLTGQLWALTVAANAWLSGDARTTWWTAAFSAACFVAVALIRRRGPKRDS